MPAACLQATGLTMVSRPIAYNLVRLAMSAIHSTPRGVDRIDFGYLSHLFEHWPGDVFGVLPTPWGVRYFPRERILAGRDRLARLWREHQPSGEDDRLERLVRELQQPPDLTPKPAVTPARGVEVKLTAPRSMWRIAQVILGDGIAPGRSMRSLPRETVYLDIGHYGITFPSAFKWRRHRPDIAPVFLIHDVIPIDFPHLVAEETVKAHHKVMKKASRHADALIVPTASAGETIRQRLAEWKAPDLPIHAVPLPIDEIFLGQVEPQPDLLRQPYFVICGAIEPRKNHALLFRIWRDLVAAYGPATPRLVIAGSPGFRSDETMALLNEMPEIRPYLIFAKGLSSPALAQVMAHARGILMPSLAEGFGLPPVEAIALGTPALVSDIPAHRDATGGWALYRAPDDFDGWKSDILFLSQDSPQYRALRSRLASFRPANWSAYMAEIGRIIQTVEPRGQR